MLPLLCSRVLDSASSDPRSQSRRSAAILRIPRLGNGRDKAITLLRDGFDVKRLVGRVAQGRAELHDSRIHAVVEIDEGVGWPEMLAQLLARDHLPRALEQQEQNARRLFAQLDDGAIAAQFSTQGVQFEDAEAPGTWRVDRHAHEQRSS